MADRFARIEDGVVVEVADVTDKLRAARDRARQLPRLAAEELEGAEPAQPLPDHMDVEQMLDEAGEFLAPYPMHPDARAAWRRAPDDAHVGWVLTGEVLAPPAARVPDLSALRALAVQLVRVQAAVIILGAAPEWKQRNMLSRAVELVSKKQEGETLDAAERAEMSQMDQFWKWARRARKFSDTAEAQIMQETDAAKLETFDPAALAWPGA